MLRRGGGQLGHGHAGHGAQPDKLPLSPLLPCPGHLATARHRISYATLAPPRSSSTTTVAGRRAPSTRPDAARVARMHVADTLSTHAAPPPRSRPGPARNALSVTTTPGRRQTLARPRPTPAVAGEETAPRHGRAGHHMRPTALGTAQPRHLRQEDRQEPQHSATPSPSSLALCSHVAMLDLAAAPYLPPPL